MKYFKRLLKKYFLLLTNKREPNREEDRVEYLDERDIRYLYNTAVSAPILFGKYFRLREEKDGRKL